MDSAVIKNLIDELQLFKTVVEESPIAMALFEGQELNVRLVNKAMLNIWKQDRSVLGQPFHQALSNIYQQDLALKLQVVYQTGEIFEVTEQEVELITNNKAETFYFNFTLKPLKDASEKTWGILYTARNTTTQVKALQEARKKEQTLQSSYRFHHLIKHAPVAIGVFTGWDMVIESANDALLELWGKDKTIVGLPMLKALPEIEKLNYINLLRDVMTTGKPNYGYEMQSHLYSRCYQKEAYFNYSYTPVTEPDGKINQVLAVAHNVTAQVIAKKELEESENRFKNLILESPMATAFYTGREMKIEVVNQPMLKFWDKDAAIIGKNFSNALPELEGQPFFKLLDDVYTTGVPYHANEKKADLLVDGNMQSFYFNFTYKPLFANGCVYGIVHVAIDVTTQVQARIALEELARKKDDFLSVASHEMKTPLTSLKASMQLINKLFKTDPASSVISVFIQKANISLIKILHLIDDLMQVSKLQQGQLPLNKTEFTLMDLLNECCDHIRAENKHELIFEGDVNAAVCADRSRIGQVVVNFVNNAVKYAPGSQKIILNIQKINNAVKLSVKDFGIGIPAEKQKHLFDRYYRVDYSGIQFSGLGLGLYISAEIIKRHEGEIGVDSVLGEGSTFWFTLPIQN
ncbi:MAG: PAS domain-containing sensor histidine kinase [Sphingobacteriaceae bacterium]|nr:MAG: PAS domain-containing sensor histidine kinase [Sphingobacteriaceae bacterium]